MGVEADINWIKSEMDKVKDPLLIETFKNLLNYRRNQQASDTVQLEMDKMILEGEEDIKKGKVISTKALRDQVSGWK